MEITKIGRILITIAFVNGLFTIGTMIAWLREHKIVTYTKLETYSIMSFKFCLHILAWQWLLIFAVERIVVGYWLKLKNQGVFYQHFKANIGLTYFLMLYFSDKNSFRCISDFFVYIYHFVFYASMASFKAVLDHYCNNVLDSQISYDLIPEAQQKIKKIKGYYQALKYSQIVFSVASLYLFSEVEISRLYSLYAPGMIVLIECFLSYENLYYKYKTAMSINEKVIAKTLNYCFALNTISMIIQVGNYFLIFSKTGLSIVFSFVHMYYMVRNFKFLFVWIKEFEKFRVFHKYRLLIVSKFPLKEYDTDKEECPICLNYLRKARELPCKHKFHLICLLQLIKNGDKKCPVCRRAFEEAPQDEQDHIIYPPRPRAQFHQPVRRQLNQINFYGLEDD